MQTLPPPESKALSPRWIPLTLAAGTFALYALLSWLCHSDQLVWDEARYLDGATWMLEGSYVQRDNPDILNGPAYPAVLAPVVAAKASLIWARLLNALFMSGAAVFTYFTVLRYAGRRWAIAASLLLALHPNFLRVSPYLMTEPLTVLCLSALTWSLTTTLRRPCTPWLWMILTALIFTTLIMTRVIFGHVASVMLIASLALLPLIKIWRIQLARVAVISALTLAFCIPYLSYTKGLTGQNLCWSTGGGELLYWMTSHHPGENGHWFSYEDAMSLPDLAPHHGDFIRSIYKLPPLERDGLFATAARRQLREAPRQALINWISNISRLLFGFPRSFRAEELGPLPIILFNLPLLFLGILAGGLMLRSPRFVPPEIWFLTFLGLVYFGGSSLPSGLPRHFVVITPVFWLVVATVLKSSISVSLISSKKTEG